MAGCRLNIFEPRYLNMVLDSLREDRLIGMVQATELAPDPIPDDAELFKIGCVHGKIVSFTETPDGRIQLVLDGVSIWYWERFWPSERVSACLSGLFQFQQDMDDPAQQLDRDVFRSLLDSYFKAKQIGVDWDIVDSLEDNYNCNLGMMCPFNSQEKQRSPGSRL